MSLQHPRDDVARHLVLLFWEPGDDSPAPEVLAHRAEVAELRARLGPGASPRFDAVSYAALLAEWEPVAPVHVAALRARYDVPVGADPP